MYSEDRINRLKQARIGLTGSYLNTARNIFLYDFSAKLWKKFEAAGSLERQLILERKRPKKGKSWSREKKF